MKEIKCFFEFIYALFLLIIILGVLIIGVLSTEKGQTWAFHTTLTSIEKWTGTHINIEHYAFAFPFELRLQQISISQNERPIATIGDLSLCCEAASLFKGNIDLSKIHIADISLFNLPLFSSQIQSKSGYSKIPFPLQINVEDISAERIRISPQIHGAFHLPEIITTFISKNTFNIHGSIQIGVSQTELIEGGFALNFTSSSTSLNQAIVVQGAYRLYKDFTIVFEDIQIENPLLQISVNGILTSDFNIKNGSFAVKIFELSPFSHLFKMNLFGDLSLIGKMEGPLSSLSWLLQVKSSRLAFNKYFFEKMHLSLQRNEPNHGQLSIAFIFQNHPWQSSAIVNWSNLEQLQFSQLEAQFLKARIQGDLKLSLLDFILEGSLEVKSDDIAVFLDTPLQGSAEVQLQLGAEMVSNHHRNQTLHATLIGNQLKWENIQTEQLILYFQMDSFSSKKGGIQFALRQFYTPHLQLQELLGSTTFDSSQSEMPFHLQGKGKMIKETALFAFDGKWTNQENSLQIEAERCTGQLGSLPFNLLAPAYFGLEQEKMHISNLEFEWGGTLVSTNIIKSKEWDIKIKAKGAIDPYLPLFFYDKIHLTGSFDLNMQLNGLSDNLQTKGTLDFINGSYESFNTGSQFYDINAFLEGNGNEIVLTKFSALDNKKGHIAGTGKIQLDPSHNFPFEFQIYPANIYVLDSDYIDIAATGNLLFKGNTEAAKLTGDLVIDRADMRLEKAPPYQIKHIDIRYINNALSSEKEPSSPLAYDLTFDIKAKAFQNIQVSGNHVFSNWKGEVTITGTQENLQLYGDLKLIEGAYDLNGKKFQFSRGNVHFAGDPTKKTTLFIVATKEIDRITAEIIVKGSTANPAISFRSNPPLPQREVLSYILFNHGLSDISSDQGEQLTQSFMSLESADQKATTDNFLSNLRNNIGVDQLDVTAQDNQNSRDFGLQVGKHINEDVTITINQGISSITPTIAIEAKLRKNIKFQAETGVGADAPIRTSIKWKKDY